MTTKSIKTSAQETVVAAGKSAAEGTKTLVGELAHAARHRCFDGGEIAPERAWLGRDHLDPNNEDGRDRDEDNGQRLPHA